MKTLYLLAPAALAAVAGSVELPGADWLKMARDYGIVVVLVWIIYYGLTTVFPAMTATHAKTIADLTGSFKDELSKERHAHSNELQAVHATMQRQNKEFLDTVVELIKDPRK